MTTNGVLLTTNAKAELAREQPVLAMILILAPLILAMKLMMFA
jgi:hypothetical protein